MRDHNSAEIRRLTTLSEGNDKGAACNAISEYLGGASLEERMATLRAISDLSKADAQKNPSVKALRARLELTDDRYIGMSITETNSWFGRLVILQNVEINAVEFFKPMTQCGK